MTNSATVKLSQVEWMVITAALEYYYISNQAAQGLEKVVLDQTMSHFAAVEKQFTR